MKSTLPSLVLGCATLATPLLGFSNQVLAAGTDSVFTELSADTIVNVGPTTLLSAPNVAGGQSVFIEADGRYFPSGGGVAANIYLTVDGVRVSNDSFIDWRETYYPVQHSFNAIAALNLSPGSHTIAMVATSTGSFTVGANSALSVMTHPASTVLQATLPSDSAPIQDNFSPYVGAPLPAWPLITQSISSDGTPIVALGSGRIYSDGTNKYGDALWYLSVDGATQCGTTTFAPSGQCSWTTSWADNDLYYDAETQAPVYVHGYFGASAATHQVSVVGTVQPSDGVDYRSGAGSTLVVLNGGMTVSGSAPISPESGYAINCPTNCTPPYTRITYSGFPPAGDSVVVDKATINIPANHNGVVFFTAKTLIQGDQTDSGGNAFLYLSIDCTAAASIPVGGAVAGCPSAGSVGVQQLETPAGDSTRTMSTSYMAAGTKILHPGTHTVTVLALGVGSFLHLSVTNYLPLLWFD